METLVVRCGDAIARLALGGARCDEGDEANEAAVTVAQVAGLVERLEMLPPSVGQCFAQRLQHHTLRLQRIAKQTDRPTEGERALWAALVARQWLAQLRVAALPAWLQASPTDVDWTALTSLQALDLSRLNAPNADDLARFFVQSFSLHALRSLNLSGLETVATDALLHTLATQCQRLEHLDLSFCSHASDSALSVFVAQNFETLRSLRLNGMRQLVGTVSLTDAIELCSHLEALALEDCVGLTRLPSLTTQLSSIVALNFHGLAHFTDREMRTTLSGCFHRLRRLTLGESELSGGSLSRLVRSSPRPTALVMLDLSWCQHVTSEAIAEVVARSPSLTALTLRCTAIEDTAIEVIGVTLAHLRVLNLERCDGLTSEGFERLARAAANAAPFPSLGGLWRLEKLNLSWTNVTSAAVVRILLQCSNGIRKLRLQGCKGVDRALLDAMGEMSAQRQQRPWPRLALVDFAWTNGAADEQLELLAKQMPSTRWIGYYGTEVG